MAGRFRESFRESLRRARELVSQEMAEKSPLDAIREDFFSSWRSQAEDLAGAPREPAPAPHPAGSASEATAATASTGPPPTTAAAASLGSAPASSEPEASPPDDWQSKWHSAWQEPASSNSTSTAAEAGDEAAGDEAAVDLQPEVPVEVPEPAAYSAPAAPLIPAAEQESGALEQEPDALEQESGALEPEPLASETETPAAETAPLPVADEDPLAPDTTPVPTAQTASLGTSPSEAEAGTDAWPSAWRSAWQDAAAAPPETLEPTPASSGGEMAADSHGEPERANEPGQEEEDENPWLSRWRDHWKTTSA